MKKYDLVVVGSGSALSVLNYGLQMGLDCALVENTKLGGTCLTRGCIPSKILVYPADLIRESEHAPKVGIKFEAKDVNWKLIGHRMWSQINESNDIEEGLSGVENLDLYKGIGEFIGDYEMQVKSVETGDIIGHFKGEKFLLATGARSFIPPIEGLKDVDFITNESFFGDKFPEKPWKSLIIIGGGIIAAEFAHIFSSVGTEVTIVEMLPRLVTTEEPEVSKFLEDNFKRYMQVYVNHKAVRVKSKKNMKIATLLNMNSDKEIEVQAEEILVATGRSSNADLLKVENTGVEIDKRGWIKTNPYLETSKENIWCIGDANGIYQFRHKANYEAEICVNNMFGPPDEKKEADYSAVPWAIYSYPQIGHVGMTEAKALEKGREIYIAIKKYSSIAKGFAMGYEKNDIDDGFVKLVVDKTYKILGAHVIGPFAAILVQPFVYLMNSGYTCELPDLKGREDLPKMKKACPEAGSFIPIYKSMVIHPSLNEVAGWAIGNLQPVNISGHHHHHHEE